MIYAKIFLKNKKIFLLYIIMILFLFVYLLQCSYHNIFQYKSMQTILYHILDAQYPLFIGMLFISYDFFSCILHSDLKEMIASLEKGNYKTYQGLFQCLMFCNALMFLMETGTFFLNAYFLNFKDVDFLWYSIKCMLIYGFGVHVFAILYAACMANLKQYWLGCISLLFPVFLNSSFFMEDVLSNTKWHTKTEGAIYSTRRIFENFYILPDGLRAEENSWYHVSILYPHVSRLLFWIVLAGIFIFIFSLQYRRASAFIKNIAGIIAMILVVSLGISTTGVFSDFIPNMDPSGSWQEAKNYYVNDTAEQLEEAEKFTILSYKINMTIKRQLEMVVEMTLSENKQTQYHFTLSHNYKLKEVMNREGQVLEFIQDGDYITVSTEKALNTIIFTYAGYSPMYYANSQGVCLPAYYCFYPRAGSIPVYNKKENTDKGYISNFVNENTAFDVSITNPNLQYYSNLREYETGHYKGQADGFSLFAGFICEHEYDGITVLYATRDAFELSESEIRKNIKNLRKLGLHDHTWIVIMPYPTCKGMNIGDKQIYVSSIYNIQEDYQKYLELHSDIIPYDMAGEE